MLLQQLDLRVCHHLIQQDGMLHSKESFKGGNKCLDEINHLAQPEGNAQRAYKREMSNEPPSQ